MKKVILSLITIMTISFVSCDKQSRAERSAKYEYENKKIFDKRNILKFEFGVIDTAMILFSQTFESGRIKLLNGLSLDSIYMIEFSIEDSLKSHGIDIWNLPSDRYDSLVRITGLKDIFRLKDSIYDMIDKIESNSKPIYGYKLLVYHTCDKNDKDLVHGVKSSSTSYKFKLTYLFDDEFNVIGFRSANNL